MENCQVWLWGKQVGNYAGGLPSGWKLTSHLGSVLNLATSVVVKRIISATTGEKTLPFFGSGDDDMDFQVDLATSVRLIGMFRSIGV